MTDMTAGQPRAVIIATFRETAARLSIDAKPDSTIEAYIHCAVRILDNAEWCLRPENIDKQPYMLRIADISTSSAEVRLEMARKAIERVRARDTLIA